MKGELPKNFAPGGGRRRRGRPHQGRDRGQPQGQPDRAGAFTAALPELLGGSADLTGSNLTNTKSTPACASIWRATW
jgi:transketolase